MEPTVPLESDALGRDWIIGICGEDFLRSVREAEASLAGAEGPCIIREEEPVAFAARFFAALLHGLPIALANPNWGTRERVEFDKLLAAGEIAPGSILIPTGGTTGGVKLAIHDWGSLEAACRAVQDFLGGAPIHSCCVLPLHHVSGLMQLLRSFLSGGSIRFDENETAGRCLSLVPTQLQRMLQTSAGIRTLKAAGTVFVGGAAMSRELGQQARSLELPIVPVYGMTETAAMIAAISKADFLASPEAGAIPLGETRLAIDPDGSIRIRTPSLFKGYHGGQALSPDEGFRTGDAGWLDPQGRLHLCGRMDRLINTGGEKVDPLEVQEVLLRLQGVARASVVGEPDEEWGEVVAAYLETAPDGPRPTEAAIRSALKTELSRFKVPKHIRFVPGPPDTAGSRD